MDSQTEANQSTQTNCNSPPPKLLIKLSNPYSSTQQNENQSNSLSVNTNTPPKSRKTPCEKEKKSKKSFSKSESAEDSVSGEENLEDSNQKSGKRIYTKRTTDKIRRWTKEESKRYEDFIESYSDIFNDPSSKRVTKIFIFMSNYIGTKTPSQCRSHHQKFFRRIQREKLLSSGKITNEEELEKLLPKKRKKKSEKNKENPTENTNKQVASNSQMVLKDENIEISGEAAALKQDVIESNEHNEVIDEPSINNNNALNIPNNGYYQEENNEINDNMLAQQQAPLNFIENEGYVDDKEWMTLFNNKTRRKSSISMLFNNNYFYQTDPELSNNLNLDFIQKPPQPMSFPEEQINNPCPHHYNPQVNGMYNINPPPSQYYYCNYHPPNQYNCYNTYQNEPINLNNNQNYNEENQNYLNNEEKSSSAMLKVASKPVVENQQILWNNAMDNVDVIDQYLKTVGENS